MWAAATTDIHPADFSDLLGRFGIDLIAERIESESTVVDLLDYDVRFGQGFLFSPPRPVRAEALQGGGGRGHESRTQREGRQARARDGAPAAPAPAEPAASAPPQPPAARACERRALRSGQRRARPICPMPATAAADAAMMVAMTLPGSSNDLRRSRATMTFCSATSGASCTTASPPSPRPAMRSRGFARAGGTVILITNAPRPGAAVQRILDRLGVPRDAYDAITSSGDVTRGIVEARLRRARVPSRSAARPADLRRPRCHLRAGRDRRLRGVLRPVRRHASRRRRATARCWRPCATRSLFMVCANPDVVVERGDTLVYCAGAMADAYAALGGEVLYCGKPYAPIYEAALGQGRGVARRQGAAARARARDRRFGANRSQGRGLLRLDCLFVISGLHAEQLGSRESPDLPAWTRRSPPPACPEGGHPAAAVVTCVVSLRRCARAQRRSNRPDRNGSNGKCFPVRD